MARNLILSRFRLRYIDYAPKNLNYYWKTLQIFGILSRVSQKFIYITKQSW